MLSRPKSLSPFNIVSFRMGLALFPPVVGATSLGRACMERELSRDYAQLVNRPASTETLVGLSLGGVTRRDYSVVVQVNGVTAD